MSGQVKRTLAMLSMGWLTSLESAQKGGVLSLSQRIGDFKKDGHHFIDKWVTTEGGARVKAWRLVKPKERRQ